MNKIGVLIVMSLIGTNVYAESRNLPPVIDNSTYLDGSKSRVTPNAPSTNSTFELMSRMEQLQQELQELRGVVEEQSQKIDDLNSKQNKIYSDFDQRIEELSGGEVVNTPDLDSLNNEVSSSIEQSIQSTTNDIKSDQSLITDTVLPLNQKETYQYAFETLRNGHNTRAISKFKELLSTYPNGEFAANSQYWLGEAYKLNNDNKSAKKAFSKVLVYYKNSSKVPDALLKLGMIELEQNKVAKAKNYLTRIITEYPSSPSAGLATQKLNKMRLFQP